MFYKLLKLFASLALSIGLAAAAFISVLAFPPSNDNFTDAEVITSLPFTTTVDITEATIEVDEPQNCYYMENTAWYSFTPSQDMLVQFSTFGTTISSNMNVYTTNGSGFPGLDLSGCSGDANSIHQWMAAGQTYYLQVGGVNGQVGEIQLKVEQIPPPANDNFADAQEIQSLPFTTTVDMVAASTEVDEPQPCNTGDTAWYSFTPSQNMFLRADTFGGMGSSQVNIYNSTSPGFPGLNFLGCTYFSGSFVFSVEAGQTYYLQVSGIGGYEGPVQVNLKEFLPPANDNFSAAENIASLPFSTVVDIDGATVEPEEPVNCYWPSSTAWYSFTPSQTMLVRADTYGSMVFGNVNVYSSSSPGFSGLNFLGCTGYSNPVIFTAEAGQTYYLQVGDAYGMVGPVQLNLAYILSPSNDDFSNATPVTFPLPFDDTVDNMGATVQVDDPTPSCLSIIYKTVWYAFTPTTSGSYSAKMLFGSNLSMAAYTGSSLADLAQVGCQPYMGNNLTIQATAGVTYYFQVGTQYPWDQGGQMQFHIDVPPPPVASMYLNPWAPFALETIWFGSGAYDPGEVGFETYLWDFGDGSTSSETNPIHTYAADGDYLVTHSVTTFDGRSASTTQTVQVRTHDVSIVKVAAPKSATSGQTREIVTFVRNTRYTESVRVDLYKSSPVGWVWVDARSLTVPVSSGNRSTNFTFSYQFTAQDAQVGKVSFQAVATLEGAREAFTQDNTRVSSATLVSR